MRYKENVCLIQAFNVPFVGFRGHDCAVGGVLYARHG